MSDSWNANQFQQGLPSQPGQVKLFDPTKFQTPAAFVGMEQPPKSQQQPQPAGGAQNPPTMQAAGSSWNSWGNWDWNADNTDPTVANQPQSGEQQNAISQHQPSQAGPGGGYQYYGDGDGQYSNAWNQGWDGAGQTYAQPDASGQYDQSQQHQYQYGGMAAQNQFGAYDPNSQQQDHQQQHQQPSQYFDGQHYDPQQQQQQQQPQSDDQSQVYNQFPGHEQFPGQAQAFYDQPYDGGNTWAPKTEEWGTGFHPHQQQQNPETSGTENAAGQNQQSGNVQSTDGESIAPPNVNPQASQDNVLTAPSLAVYNHDDDGTVSGFFGRDDDGDVQLTSQKHGQSSFTSGDQGTGDVSSSNQFLGVDPSFHRTNSEISNASLSTLNMSNGDDEDGMEPLHNVQDLVQRMQEVDLSVGQGHSQETNVANLSDNNVPVAPNSSAVVDQGQQHRGDYTGFGNTVSDHSAPPPNLPLDTNMRPSSPDINHPSSAESGGSGASGASSGLADWEIVPPQSEQLTHSRNSSLDNSASFFSDKPDGGVSLSAGDGNTVGQGVFPQGSQPPPFSSVSEESVHRNFENMDPSKHSSPRDSSSAASFQEPNPQHREQNRRSGSPFVAAVTDSSQEESAPKTHRTSPTKSLPGPNLSAPPPSQPSADGTANPFRREGGRSPRHASLPQPTKPDGTGSTAGLGSGDAKTAATPQQSADSQRKGMAALPSKPKVPSGSSTDDGSRLSRRDSDQSIKSTDSSSTRGKQGGEPQVRSSSRNSEEVALSSQHRRHHSAFHPVSRPRQTAMSPATTLWDNTETPTPNILLAPAMPLIIPGLNQYSASTTATSTTDAQSKGATQTAKSDNAGDRSSQRGQNTSEGRDKTEERNRKEDKNRSFDSLDELNPEAESPRDRSYRSQRSDPRESRQGRDPYRRDPDRPPSRYERPSSRNDRGPGQYQYERPSSRTDAYPRDRQRGYYRDYGDSYDERYDRPRSRQDESRGSRPSSRSGQEVDRPRSRNEYDRDRDYYYKDRHRGYAYDSYGRHLDYYNDERERYYRYYKDREARYTRGYYEEYYGTKHAEYYQQYQQQLQQQQQQQQQSGRHSRPDYERSSSRSQSRGNTPGPVTSRGNTPAHVSSRGNTPGVPPSPGVAPSPGPDYYNNRGSRPSSRTDYARDYYGRGYAYDGYQAYYDGYGYDPYAYGYGYPGYEDYSQAQDQGRLTPPKYSYPHVRASFGPNGQLVKVLPNRPADGQPAIVEVQDVQSVLESCPEAEELKQFPGPLTRTNTHKKDVLLFCQLKARACAEDINMTDRESAQLIWKFLELLIKQNGSVVGTDLSDLLLEGHEPSTHEYSLHGMRISNSSDALDTVPEGNSEDTGSARGSPAVRVTSDRTVISSADREREKWIDRFRHLLLYGRKKDALECAMKNNLWGHALFLASKMDTRTHANVMTRFANSAMRMNDPLQTLYQLMSGRQPAAVTCVGDERWGDWRPHLAMVLSNSTSRHDLDRKSISTLGDTLASKGYLHASHFCYLMAQVNFGSYNKKTSKIVLIGSSHNLLPMEEFATNEAIQCTEVYEYAQVLGNAAFCLPYFQMYKYLYACRLADYGMASEALHYCEVIATNVQQYPTWFQPSFVKLVFQLSSKMKFSDPQRQHTSEDAEDPVWLQQLEKVCSAYDDGTIQPVSGTATPAGFPGTTTSSESGDYNPYAYGYSGDTSAMSGTGVDAYGNVQHQQQAQYGTDYYSNQDPNAVAAQAQAQNVTGTTDPQYQQQQGYDQQQQGYDQQQQLQQQQYDYNQWQQQYGYQYAGYGDHYTQPPQQQQQPHDEQHHAAGEDSTEHQQYSQHTTPQHQHQQQQQHEGEADGSHQQYQYDGSLTYSNNAAVTPRDAGHDDGAGGSAAAVADDKASLGGAPLDASSASSQLSAQLHPQGYDQYGTTTGQQHQQFPPRASISTNETEDEDNVNDDDDDDDEDVTDAPTSGFDYFGNVGQQKVVAPPHRFRSMSGSSTGSTRRRRTTSGSSTGSVKAAPHKPAPPPGGPLGSKPGDKKAAPAGKGWFSGLFGKLGAKGKNEMILPDDKNPAIVWDPVKNKWTNADGEEQDEAPAAPPPKDTDLMGKPSAAPPSASMPPPPSVPAGGNRFSLKNKGARNQYVDVNNPKPVAVPQDLFNVMPGTTAPSADGSATTAAPQLFLPGGVPSGDTSANNSASNTNTNNSSLSVPGTDDRLSRSSSVSSFSQEVQQYMAEPAADTSATQAPAAAVQSQQPAAMPMLFNPASLKTNKAGAGQASSAAGPGLKYGQRRAYPK